METFVEIVKTINTPQEMKIQIGRPRQRDDLAAFCVFCERVRGGRA